MLPRLNEKSLPCVADKCEKGHYSDQLQLSPSHARIIELYRSCKATSGACLTEAERQDSIVTFMLGMLDAEFERAKAMRMEQNIAALVMRGIANGRAQGNV